MSSSQKPPLLQIWIIDKAIFGLEFFLVSIPSNTKYVSLKNISNQHSNCAVWTVRYLRVHTAQRINIMEVLMVDCCINEVLESRNLDLKKKCTAIVKKNSEFENVHTSSHPAHRGFRDSLQWRGQYRFCFSTSQQ